MAITHLPIRMQLGGFPMFPPGMGPSIGMPRGGMGQVRRPPPPSDEDEGGRRAPTPFSLEDLSPRRFQAPRAPNLFVGGPSVYNPFQSFPSFGGYGGDLPPVPRYGGRTGGPFGPPPPSRGYPMGGGMPGFGRDARPFRPRPRPQPPQFDFDEDQLRSFFQNMMGPQDTSEMTALQDRIKELEGQISGFQTPGGVEEETTVTETETIPTPTPTPTPTPQVPTPTPQEPTWQLPPEIQEQIDALQVDIPNINLPGLGRTEPNGDQPSFDLPPALSTVFPPEAPVMPPTPEVINESFERMSGWPLPTEINAPVMPPIPTGGPPPIDTLRNDFFYRGPDGSLNKRSKWSHVPENMRSNVYSSHEDLVASEGKKIVPMEEYMASLPLPPGLDVPRSPVMPPIPTGGPPPIDTLPPPIPFGPGHPLFDPPREDRGSVVPRMPPPIEQFGGTVIPRMPQQPGPKIRPRPIPPGGRGPGAPINIPRQPRIDMEQLLAGLGGLGPGGP